VGCNGIDLTELTFNECMSVIRHADWPKTLHFIRDPNTANLKPTLKEAWAKFGTAGSLRRRYLEVKEGEVLYSKPTPGGAISATPDGRMTDLAKVRKVEDRTAGDDERFQVVISTKNEGLEVRFSKHPQAQKLSNVVYRCVMCAFTFSMLFFLIFYNLILPIIKMHTYLKNDSHIA
jgi:hypothetical protein